MLRLSLSLFNLPCLSCSNRLFLCLDSFILSLCVACLPVCVKIVQKNCQAIADTDKDTDTTYCCYGIS